MNGLEGLAERDRGWTRMNADYGPAVVGEERQWVQPSRRHCEGPVRQKGDYVICHLRISPRPGSQMVAVGVYQLGVTGIVGLLH